MSKQGCFGSNSVGTIKISQLTNLRLPKFQFTFFLCIHLLYFVNSCYVENIVYAAVLQKCGCFILHISHMKKEYKIIMSV